MDQLLALHHATVYMARDRLLGFHLHLFSIGDAVRITGFDSCASPGLVGNVMGHSLED